MNRNRAPGEPVDPSYVSSIPERCERVFDELSKAIVGQRPIIEQMLIALFCDSHSILVGVPGLAKTRMVRSLSNVLDLDFNRVQFTPDLMPSDVTGTEILQESDQGRQFEFRRGPIFTDILLADEINRTPPKTQSALLQAMQERSITAGGTTFELSVPFFVLATQNPIEQEGTYPLPEAQLDRFMFYIKVEYPDAGEEEEVVRMTTGNRPTDLQPVMSREDVLRIQRAVRGVPADDAVIEETVQLVRLTRPEESNPLAFVSELVEWGAGPRASQHLILAGKARALIEGDSHVTRDHIRALAQPTLRHRIVRSFTAESEDVNTDRILTRILDAWPQSPRDAV